MYGLVGVLAGVSAFLIDVIVDNLVIWKWSVAQSIMVNQSLSSAMLTFIMMSSLIGGSAAILTVFVGPGAIGSGTTELIAYLNGINYPKFIGMRTLFVKMFGTCLAVSAGLCVGKEGPLAHIGAIIGHAILYLPFPFLYKFRNEVDKREIACAGAAAGVSAAFGSPIGGSLLIYEVSKPSSFWSFDLTWKIFFSSSVATFCLNILSSLKKGEPVHVMNAGLIKFGQYNSRPYELKDFPFFVILGICGGLLGSFFNFINFEVNVLRRIYLNTNWKKVCETLFLCMLTSFLIFSAPLITRSSCEKINDQDELDAEFI
jgi:chloride channel 7